MFAFGEIMILNLRIPYEIEARSRELVGEYE